MPYPASPAVRRAIRNFDLASAPFYVDGYYGSQLIPFLARRFKIPEAQISTGYGAEFFLRSIFDACDPIKDIVLTNAPHYGFYSIYAKAKEVRLETFQLTDLGDRFEFDVEDCVRKIKKFHPKVVLITSPNNPTGNSIAPGDLKKILEATQAAKKKTLVVLDEAYAGFNEQYDMAVMIGLLKKYEDLVVLRSLSKRFALAGLRIGFALWGKKAKEIIKYQDLYLGPSRLLEAVAVAALESQSYYKKLARNLIREREKFIVEVNKLHSFKAYHSDANFVLVKVAGRVKQKLERELAKLPAQISKFVMPQFMRVSLGSPKDTQRFIRTLRNVDRVN